MIQLNQIQLTSQTTNHVENTKILSISQRESRIIDCYYQNWFLKSRLESVGCVNYARDWQLGLKKNLQQDSVVKPAIFTTQKMKFSVKDLFNKSEQIRCFMRICSRLLNKFLMEKFIFVHWFVQVNRQKTTMKKKTTYFFEKLGCFFIQNFWKSPCNLQIFLPLGV